MTTYDNDDRVVAYPSGRSFSAKSEDGAAGEVQFLPDGQWRATREPGSFQDYPTADEAIRSLIGDPQ